MIIYSIFCFKVERNFKEKPTKRIGQDVGGTAAADV